MNCGYFTTQRNPDTPPKLIYCPRQGTHFILNNDGEPATGTPMCEQHAQAIVDNYNEELDGYHWSIGPIP